MSQNNTIDIDVERLVKRLRLRIAEIEYESLVNAALAEQLAEENAELKVKVAELTQNNTVSLSDKMKSTEVVNG